jgi:hypothetical protein
VLLRGCFELPLPIHELVDLIEPEVLYSEAARALDEKHNRVDAGILRVLSPGDVVTWNLVQDSACKSDEQSVVAKHISENVLRCSPLMFSKVDLEKLPSPGNVRRRQNRYAVRRNFPQQGCHTAVKASCSDGANSDEVACYEELDSIKALVCVLTSSMHGRGTLINSLVRLQHGSTVAHLLNGLKRMPRPLAFFATKFPMILRLKESPLFKEVLCEDADYVVLVLRRCPRGPPLLPACPPENQVGFDGVQKWIQAPEYNLCKYLQALFTTMGVQAAVFSSYRGSALMPYQAVMLRRDWNRSWPLCDSVWRQQKAAYRHMHGGKSSPDIHEATEVRCGETSPSTKCAQHTIPISHTFIHFRPEPLCAENRVRSDSTM